MFLAAVGAFTAAIFTSSPAQFQGALFLVPFRDSRHASRQACGHGRLKKYMPITFATCLQVAAFQPYQSLRVLSKDEILWKTWSADV